MYMYSEKIAIKTEKKDFFLQIATLIRNVFCILVSQVVKLFSCAVST